jgi:membrane-bound lytic murein transglycosylase B
MKLISSIVIFLIFNFIPAFSDENLEFKIWKKNFKKIALQNNISEKTFDTVMSNTKFLPNVIKYDRYQPEFYEDTKTYISKRTSDKKVSKGLILYKKNIDLINSIEKEFNIEKELLLSLMGIETNFGTYVGKMDILSSLATLSYDKRRSEFFTNELLILLNLIEKKQIDYKTLYGSWAGAFGFFQFMPSTMKNYAIDYDDNNYIDLKNNVDAYASAANYLKKIGWKINQPCFYKISLSNDIPKKYLNVSAKKLKNKKKLKYFRNYINDNSFLNQNLDDFKCSDYNSRQRYYSRCRKFKSLHM